MPRRGYRAQPGVSTPGTAEPRKCALQGAKTSGVKTRVHDVRISGPFRANHFV
jgi:hypothetical protein